MLPKRGEVYWVDFGHPDGTSVQAGRRPAIIIQANEGNQYSTVTIVVAVTTTIKPKKYPCDVIISDDSSCLEKPSRIMCNQIFTIPQTDLGEKIGELNSLLMTEIDKALKIILGL